MSQGKKMLKKPLLLQKVPRCYFLYLEHIPNISESNRSQGEIYLYFSYPTPSVDNDRVLVALGFQEHH